MLCIAISRKYWYNPWNKRSFSSNLIRRYEIHPVKVLKNLSFLPTPSICIKLCFDIFLFLAKPIYSKSNVFHASFFSLHFFFPFNFFHTIRNLTHFTGDSLDVVQKSSRGKIDEPWTNRKHGGLTISREAWIESGRDCSFRDRSATLRVENIAAKRETLYRVVSYRIKLMDGMLCVSRFVLSFVKL